MECLSKYASTISNFIEWTELEKWYRFGIYNLY